MRRWHQLQWVSMDRGFLWGRIPQYSLYFFVLAAPRPAQQLWRSWVGQLRQVFQRWHPALPSSTTTPHPRLQLRSTTPQAEELKPYGALNPMFQLHF